MSVWNSTSDLLVVTSEVNRYSACSSIDLLFVYAAMSRWLGKNFFDGLATDKFDGRANAHQCPPLAMPLVRCVGMIRSMLFS